MAKMIIGDVEIDGVEWKSNIDTVPIEKLGTIAQFGAPVLKGKEVLIECEFRMTPEAADAFDRLSWDNWAADVAECIVSGDVIKAASAVLMMCRFAVGVQLSDYGASTVKNCVNQFFLIYGEGGGE